MKRSLNIASILLILLSGIAVFYLFRAADTARANVAFGGFPINHPRTIDFDVNTENLADKTRREQLDQKRDWMLYAVLSDSGKSIKELSEMLYDLPATRNGYMHQVANFEYGDTRSRFIGDGQVVALIPAGDTSARVDQLAHIADEHRKNIGDLPVSVLVFEYKLNANDDENINSGEITRRETIDGKTLFTPEYGYYENQIKNLDDLKQFMQQVDDLVFAQRQDGSLKLGGRKIRGRSYRGISVEDVAAIWQSERNLSGGKEGSGFSLDPTYDFDKVKEFFNAGLAPIEESFTNFDLDESDEWMQPRWRYVPLRPKTRVTADQVRQGLNECHIEPLFAWIDHLRSTNSEIVDLAEARLNRFSSATGESGFSLEEFIADAFSFQQARYDGDLKGTQVGMILFYTDLVAKLWAFDYKETAPREIEGFKSQVEIHRQLSSVFGEEIVKTPRGRLWFGPDIRGYAASKENSSLLFSRRATRLFAKSSASIGSGNEAEPQAGLAGFINWWDDHFEEVARYEPQYERLNEIMKWSLVITWLNQASEGRRLSFLDNPATVNRSYRFPDWVKQQPDLRFDKWDDNMFLKVNSKCVTTEALPLLQSKRFAMIDEKEENWYLAGGVSLGRQEIFAERTFLSAESKVASLARRSGLDYAPLKSSENTVATVDGAAFKFQPLDVNRMAVTSTPRAEAALRSNYGNIVSQKFESVLAHERTGLNVATKYGETGVGNLSVSRTGNRFSVGWRSRDLDLGQRVARKVSSSAIPDEVLAADPTIQSALKLPGGEGYLIKISGSDRWTRLSKSSGPVDGINSQARIADLRSSSKPMDVGWWDQARVEVEISTNSYMTLKVDGTGSRGALLEITESAPVNTGRPITILQGEHRINAVFDPQSKSVFVKYRDLPEVLKKNPGELQRAASKVNVEQLGREGVWKVTDATPWKNSLTSGFENKDYLSLSTKLTESPSQFKSTLETNLKERLQQSDTFIANRNYHSADSELNDLMELYGPRPELLIRKGVAQIRAGEIKSAAPGLHDGFSRFPRPSFLDEINLRLRSGVGPTDPTVELVAGNTGFNTRVKIPTVRGAEKVQGAKIDSGNFYIQDSPRLNNLDWQNNFQGSLKEVISGEFGEVVKLPRGNLNSYSPTEIYVGDTGKTFFAAQKTTTSHKLILPKRVPILTQCHDERDDQRNCDDVYLVRERPQ